MRVRSLYRGDEIRERVRALAAQIARDYSGGPPLVVWIAEGAERFAEALRDALGDRGRRPELHSIRARRTRGTDLRDPDLGGFDLGIVRGRQVLVVDDIADEGRTLRAVVECIAGGGAGAVRTAVLVSKLERRTESIGLDYVAFEVERGWVVGFGMDLDGAYRDLDEIGVVEGE